MGLLKGGSGILGAAAFWGGGFANGPSAEATDSAYASWEKDWQERSDSGEIQYSSAKSLRKQLQEIAPMNSANSEIFCPNGPSANVSPLMENKCGDKLAMPSRASRRPVAILIVNSVFQNIKQGANSILGIVEYFVFTLFVFGRHKQGSLAYI